MKILITGAAGFIGFHLAKRFLNQKNIKVIGIDNINSYYDKTIKKKRIQILKKYKNFSFIYGDLKNNLIFKNKKFTYDINYIYHFAGQAGVRYSIQKPNEYIKDNIISYVNLLENFKNSKKLKCIFYASSSSVYGNKSSSSSKFLQASPISVYAVSKLSMELLSNAYLYLFDIKCVGLRFFTVYGPWGRPDMAYFKFCNLISKNKKIEVFNNGKHSRSFTYIDDVIENIIILQKNLRKINYARNNVFNVGNPKTVSLKRFIQLLEKNISIKAKKLYKKKQLGDVLNTKCNLTIEKKLFNFKFKTNIETGIRKFVKWYLYEYKK